MTKFNVTIHAELSDMSVETITREISAIIHGRIPNIKFNVGMMEETVEQESDGYDLRQGILKDVINQRLKDGWHINYIFQADYFFLVIYERKVQVKHPYL